MTVLSLAASASGSSLLATRTQGRRLSPIALFENALLLLNQASFISATTPLAIQSPQVSRPSSAALSGAKYFCTTATLDHVFALSEQLECVALQQVSSLVRTDLSSRHGS